MSKSQKNKIFEIIIKLLEKQEEPTQKPEEFQKNDLTDDSEEELNNSDLSDDDLFKSNDETYYEFISLLVENNYITNEEIKNCSKFVPNYEASASSLIGLLCDIKKWNITRRYSIIINKLMNIIKELKKSHKAYNFNKRNFKYDKLENIRTLQEEGMELFDKLNLLEDVIIETNETIKLKIVDVVRDELLKLVQGGILNDFVNQSIKSNYEIFDKKVNNKINKTIEDFNKWNVENLENQFNKIDEFVKNKTYKLNEQDFIKYDKVNDILNNYIKNNINKLILSNVGESDPIELLNGIYQNVLRNNKMLLSTNEKFKNDIIELTTKTQKEIKQVENIKQSEESNKDKLINELVKNDILKVTNNQYEVKKINFKKYYKISNDKFVESLNKLNIENKTKLRLYKNEIIELIEILKC